MMKTLKQWMVWMIGFVIVFNLSYAFVQVKSNDDKSSIHRHISRQSGQILFIRSSAIEVAIAPNGQFTIGVPNGPILLFGHPDPWSSATTIRVDGVDYWNYYGTKFPQTIDGPRNESDLSNVTVWNINGVKITQRLTIVGDRLDVVKITYIIKNTTSSVREVGLRLMLDTMLGDNDGAPFRVPGTGAVTREREWIGGQVPAYWQAFDRLERYTVATQGTLAGGEATLPDRLVAANWEHINDTPWDFTPDPNIVFSTPGQTGTGEENDSAVGIYWNPVRLLPQQTRTIVTYYGLSRFESSGQQLVVSEPIPQFPILNSVSAYTLTVNIQAVNTDQTNVIATLRTDSNALEIADEAAKRISQIKAGMTETVTWLVRPTGMVEGKYENGQLKPATTTVSIEVRSDQTPEPVKISKDIQIGCLFLPVFDSWKFLNHSSTFEQFVPIYKSFDISYPIPIRIDAKFFPPLELWKSVFDDSQVSIWFWEKKRALAYIPKTLPAKLVSYILREIQASLLMWTFNDSLPGVCYGMSAYSIKFSLYSRYPATQWSIDQTLAYRIFEDQIKQWSRNHITALILNSGPRNLLKALQEDRWDIVICISAHCKAHALVPWKLETTEEEYRIYVYDPNYPKASDRYIRIPRNERFWMYEFAHNDLWVGIDIIWGKGNAISYVPLEEFYQIVPLWKPSQSAEFGENSVAVQVSGEKIYKVIVKDNSGRAIAIYDPVKEELQEGSSDQVFLMPSWIGCTAIQSYSESLSSPMLFLPPSGYTFEFELQNVQESIISPIEIIALGHGGAIGLTLIGSTNPVIIDIPASEKSVSFEAGSSPAAASVDLFKVENGTEGVAHVFLNLSKFAQVTVRHTNEGSGVVISSERASATASVELRYITKNIISQGVVQQIEINPSQPVRIRLSNPTNPNSSVTIEIDRNNDGSFDETKEVGLDTVSISLPQGIYPLSFPIIPRDSSWQFLVTENEQVKLAFWDNLQQYQIVTLPFDEVIVPDQFRPSVGRAVWLRLPSQRTISLKGTFPERLSLTSIALRKGWNLVGTLSISPIDWSLSQIRVRKGNEIRNLTQAQQAGWIEDYAWGWEQDENDPFKGKYVLVYDTSIIPGVQGQLEPWKGYWVYAHTDCELILPPPSKSKGQVTRGKGQVKGNGWAMKLVAKVGDESGEAILGVSQGSRGLAVGLPPEPPEGSRNVQVILLNNGAPLAVDVRNSMRQRQEWEVVVKWDTGQGTRGMGQGKEVTLTFDGIGYAPKDVSLWLVDTVTGKRLYMRTQSAYRFVPNDGETSRNFKVIAELGNERPLQVVGLKAIPMRGRSLAIQFALTKAAQTQVEVMTLTGRKVAVLESGRSRLAGQQQIVWQGRGNSGELLPASSYLIRVIATDKEGRQVQATAVARLR